MVVKNTIPLLRSTVGIGSRFLDKISAPTAVQLTETNERVSPCQQRV